MAIKDDELKVILGGVDPLRVQEAYQNVNGLLAGDLQTHLNSGYLQPNAEDLRVQEERINSFLQSGKLAIVVPMRERGPVIRPLLNTLIKERHVALGTILVVNDGSDKAALDEVRQHNSNVHLVSRDEVLDVLKWDKLLRILNLRERPRGKGVAVLAGYLSQYIWARRNDRHPLWLGQNDAEIAQFDRYQCWEHLGYGIVTRPGAQYVKMAKFGRTNERCMAARWMLLVFAQAESVAPEIQRRAEEMAYRLGRHKWMLTGEFALRWELAMDRPFATGYLEETLTSLFSEDYCAQWCPEGDGVVQVANPNPRLDAANDERKEAIMQQQISNFILSVALGETLPIDQWGIETIKRLNHTIMADPIVMGWIPLDEGSVKAEVAPNNRLIPSITMLDRAKLIDWENAKNLSAP